MDNDLYLFIRDISQAHVQSDFVVQRPVFVRPPSLLHLEPGTIRQVERPLYGLP